MGRFRVIPKEIKEQVLKRIKDDGISIVQAAADAGIHPDTIRNWLTKGVN